KLARGDEIIAWLEQRMEHDHLRTMPRGYGKPRSAAFERSHALLQHRLGRVGDARIDVAERLEIEQSRRVVHVVEHIGRGLVDRSRACAGRGIRLSAGMDGKRIEAGLWLRSHCHFLCGLEIGGIIATSRARLCRRARDVARPLVRVKAACLTAYAS